MSGLAALVGFLRAQEAATLMHTTVRVDRPGALGAFNPATGQHADGTTVGIYAGQAAVIPAGDTEQNAAAADTPIDLHAYRLRFPTGTDVVAGDLVTITADELVPARVGLVITIEAAEETRVSRRATGRVNRG